MEEKRVLVRKIGGKKSLGILRRRWAGSVQKYLKVMELCELNSSGWGQRQVEWCYESRDEHHVSINTGNFFARFSRRTVLHGVSWISRYGGYASEAEKIMRTTKKKNEWVSNESIVLVGREVWKWNLYRRKSQKESIEKYYFVSHKLS
jgi:hypothetical protein